MLSRAGKNAHVLKKLEKQETEAESSFSSDFTHSEISKLSSEGLDGSVVRMPKGLVAHHSGLPLVP